MVKLSLQSFKKLFTIDYYLAILSGKQKYRAFLVIFIVVFILSAVTFIRLFLPAYPIIKSLDSRINEFINEMVKDDLEITIKNGIVSTNVTEPYYLTFSQEMVDKVFNLKNNNQSLSKARILTIDTKAKAEDLEKYQSLALLTQTNLIYYKDSQINIYPLRNLGDLTINKKIILEQFKEINSKYHLTQVLLILMYLAPILLILGTYLIILLSFLFLAIGIFIMAKINQLSVGFRNIYRYTIAIAFIPIVIWEFLSAISPLTPYTQLLDQVHTIIIFAIAYYGICKYKERKGVLSS